MNYVIDIRYVGHDSAWRREAVQRTAKQLAHVDGLSVATWEPVQFADLASQCIWVADNIAAMFSVPIIDPIEQAHYEQAKKVYDPKWCKCSTCTHYRSMVKTVGKDRMPAPGTGCQRQPVKPEPTWCRAWLCEDLTGVLYIRKWDRTQGKYVESWVRFTGCKHDYEHRSPYNCYHEYKCKRCGHAYAVDSSD